MTIGIKLFFFSMYAPCLFTQSKTEMLKLSESFPPEAFSNAIEPILNSERAQLIQNGKGDFWTIEILRNDFIKLTYSETGDHFIRIKKLKFKNGDDLILVHMELDRKNTLENCKI